MMSLLFVSLSFPRERCQKFLCNNLASIKVVLLREGRIQVAGLENANESFEKRYASSNDTEIHHLS